LIRTLDHRRLRFFAGFRRNISNRIRRIEGYLSMLSRTLTTCLGFLTVLILTTGAVHAAEPLPRAKVGEIASWRLSTEHPYPAGDAETFEIRHPGATYVKVHFSKFELADGDRLEILSADGTERYVFEGRGYKHKGEDFWVNSVLGDTVVLRLYAKTGGGYGFDVDYYAYGTVPLVEKDSGQIESVCGTNDWRDVACYETSYPTEFDRAKRAVVVLYNGTENCTGVKVGCPNQILTNEHCVTSQGEVDVTEVRFEYQTTACDGTTSGYSESYLGDLFIQDDYALDYSLITVQGSSDNYEAAEIDPRLPPVGERLYITGHPAGDPKKLSLEDSGSPTGLCRVDLSPTDGRGTDTDVGYYCDTTGGSSGSPVWSGESHALIALHHYGGCPNSGIRMDLIYPEISSLLTPCCDLPPNTPTLDATSAGDNRIDLTWDDSDLATVVEYQVLRSRTQGGPYDQIATVADSSPGAANGSGYLWTDTDVSGGIIYYYAVVSTDGERCTSDPSNEASATATGACTLPPVFDGLQDVSTPFSETCTLDLSWNAAVPECGGPVLYDVYRSATPGFTPDQNSLLSSGITATTFRDIDQLVSGTPYHYVVRATDTSNGVGEANDVEVGGVPYGNLTNGTWTDDAGDTGMAQMVQDAPWFTDPAEGNLGPSVYKTGSYGNGLCAGLSTPELWLGAGARLTFSSKHAIESSWDKGEVQISTDGGSTWQRVELAYPGSSTHTSDACGLPTGSYFTGTDLTWNLFSADLSAWGDNFVTLRFVLSSDGSVNGDGWWIDDISITEVGLPGVCFPGSACPDNPLVNVVPDGPMTVCQGEEILLSADLEGGSGPFHYQWTRDGVEIPGETDATLLAAETGTHTYNVRVRADACPDPVTDSLSTGIQWQSVPTFAGVESAVDPQSPSCTVDLDWTPAFSPCPSGVTYAVYRDTTTPVVVDPANLVASVAQAGYSDSADLVSGQAYHYVVRAVDNFTGESETNTVEASAVPSGPGSGPVTLFVENFEDAVAWADWTVTTGPGPHDCGEFQRVDQTGGRPVGSTGFFALADSDACGSGSLTSTALDSPVIDADVAGAVAITLSADMNYRHYNGDDATVEVWDGAAWQVIWTDPNANDNQHYDWDVTAYALGNPGFRVRFNYQNAAFDYWFGVDNVEVVADIDVPCETVSGPTGPAPAPDGRGVTSPVTGFRSTPTGDTIRVEWDTANCTATGYNLIFGDLADVSTYALSGSRCDIGTSGSYDWTGVPVGDLFFLVVGHDGAGTESSWGLDGQMVERNGSFASGECGASVKDPSGTCP
jgi:V8-like Glu-specific endopeptidase